MRAGHSVFTNALSRVTAPVLLPLLAGNVLLAIAACLALLIPDSHVWQLALSLLLALGLLSGFLLWNASAMRRLRSAKTGVPLWHAAFVLALWVLVAALLSTLIGRADSGVEVRAGYWNSQISSGARHLLSYPRLIALQTGTLRAVRWVVLPALLLPLCVETVAFGLRTDAFKRAARVTFSALHLAVAIVALGLAAYAVPALASWHPAHTVGTEIVSATLRLGLAVVLAVSSALLLLAVDAELLHRSSGPEPLPTASPDPKGAAAERAQHSSLDQR